MQNNPMGLNRRLFQWTTNAKFALVMTVTAGFLAGIAVIAQARLISAVIARVFLESQQLPQVMPLMLWLLAVQLVRAGLSYLSETAASSTALRVKEHLRSLLARKLFDLGPAFAQNERSGELVNTVTQGVEALDAYFSQYLPQLALAGILPVAFLAAVFPLDPLSGLALLLTGPLIPLFMVLIGGAAQKQTNRQWTALSRMSAYFLDTLQGMVTLKALGRSREQIGRIARVSEQYRETTMSVLRVAFISALALELLATVGVAVIAVQIGLRLLYGGIGFETAFFVLLLAPEFYQPLRALGLRFHASTAGVSAAVRIFEVLDQPVIKTGAAGLELSAVETAPITFRGVSYTYPGREQAALKGLNLEIQPGKITALVGASGAGKSTIVNLLLGFIQPDEGEILVGGVPLAQIAPARWREQIAWTSQQPYLFHGTIADNLRIALPDASLEDLRRALAQAHMLEWVEGQPLGMDTPVGEAGARLSGGQAQRLALARAFLRRAPLLILDEPTAHLDVEQERLLQESTRRLLAGRTALVIAHRLSTAVMADAIVVIEGGAAVERGTHAQLLASAEGNPRGGAYARLLASYQGGAQ